MCQPPKKVKDKRFSLIYLQAPDFLTESAKHKSRGVADEFAHEGENNKAEFFAVVTKRYFEEPEKLKKDFPELYKELNMFYNVYD